MQIKITHHNLSGEDTFVVTTEREKWLALIQKALHGKHAHALTQPHVDHYLIERLVDLGWTFPCNGGFYVRNPGPCI